MEEVRAQYEALALRSWEEAEALTRRKVFVSLSDLHWGEAGEEAEERDQSRNYRNQQDVKAQTTPRNGGRDRVLTQINSSSLRSVN